MRSERQGPFGPREYAALPRDGGHVEPTFPGVPGEMEERCGPGPGSVAPNPVGSDPVADGESAEGALLAVSLGSKGPRLEKGR